MGTLCLERERYDIMNQESTNVSIKTWFRSIDTAVKTGYKDGGAEGQAATFQSSFNIGYTQGLKFGLQIGFDKGGDTTQKQVPEDTRRINCQLCINGAMSLEKVDNLYNAQEECNVKYLQK